MKIVFTKNHVILKKTLQKKNYKNIDEKTLRMIKNKIFFIIIIFLIQLSVGKNINFKKFRKYIENKFNVILNTNYVITTHTMQDIYNKLVSEDYRSEKNAKKILNTCLWKTNADVFIDSVYSRDSCEKLHGVFLDFDGDSLSHYRLTFYEHGIIDSIDMLYDCWGGKKFYRYKNGVKNGIWESIDRNGTRRWLNRYKMGKIIDTSYEWYDNGNLIAKRYYENDEIVWEKCYEEDGETEMECDF